MAETIARTKCPSCGGPADIRTEKFGGKLYVKCEADDCRYFAVQRGAKAQARLRELAGVEPGETLEAVQTDTGEFEVDPALETPANPAEQPVSTGVSLTVKVGAAIGFLGLGVLALILGRRGQ